jgi:hypothetical protein
LLPEQAVQNTLHGIALGRADAPHLSLDKELLDAAFFECLT